jgi:cytochrome c-type biogenesis protein CcmE
MRNESGARTLPVRFEGVTPGLFRDGTNVIASGRLGSDGVFRATELMTKCPSKYEGVETPHGENAEKVSGSPPAPAAAPLGT